MYTALPEVYDLFDDSCVKQKADYYCGFLPGGGYGADLGCGTGKLSIELLSRGYGVYGIDNSNEMLLKAASNASKNGADLKLVNGDARRIPHSKPLSFVIAANDVFNYVKPKELNSAFVNVYASLKPDGVFVFDISSEYKLKNILGNNVFTQTKNDVTYVWQNFLRKDKVIIDFTVFSPDNGTYIKTYENQIQYIHSIKSVKAALSAAGFKITGVYAYGKKSAPTSTTPKILFAARR